MQCAATPRLSFNISGWQRAHLSASLQLKTVLYIKWTLTEHMINIVIISA